MEEMNLVSHKRLDLVILLAGATLFFVGVSAGLLMVAQSYDLLGGEYGYVDRDVRAEANDFFLQGSSLVFLGIVSGVLALLFLRRRPVRRPNPSENVNYSLLPTIITCPDCGTKNARTDSQCRKCDRDLTDVKRTLAQSAVEA